MKKKYTSEFKKETIDQIKNVTQEKKIKSETQTEIKTDKNFPINSFVQLLEICTVKKKK